MNESTRAAVAEAKLSEIEASLHLSERRLATYLQGTPLGFLELDRDLVVREWNASAERIFGFTRAEALGQHIYDLIVPAELRGTIDRLWVSLVEGSGGNRSTNENVTKDGRRIVCEWYNSTLRDQEGRFAGVIAMCDDITSRSVMERALKASEARLRAVFEASRDAIGVSVDGVHIFCNPAYLHMFGYDNLGELVGRPILDLIAPSAHADINARVRRRSAGEDVPNDYLTRGKKRDGEEFDLLVKVSPYLQDGRVHTLVTMRDMTDLRRAEAALRESEERYRALFETMQEGFALHELIVDESGKGVDFRFLAVNPSYERLTGASAADIVGRTAREVLAPEDLVRIPRYQAVVETGVPAKFEAHSHRFNRHFALSVYRTGPERFAVIFNDLTERDRAEGERLRLEQQMQQVQRLESLGVLAGGIAHDFNNILMAILGNVDLVLDTLPPDAVERESMLEIEKAARRAAELTKQMLAYSGKGRFVVRSIDLREVVEDTAQMLAASVSKKATLRFVSSGDPVPRVVADAAQIRQVLVNLATNASEALGDQSGFITVSTGSVTCDRAYLADAWLAENVSEGLFGYLEVADTGCGIDRESLGRIFDPFFSTKFAGRGLGLPAVFGIVRGHKGAIKVESAVGRGTKVRVLLPAAALTKVRPESAPAAPAGWRGRGTVLLVDDEEPLRVMGRRMLEQLGFEVLVAENGLAAVEVFAAKAGQIRCVVLDLTMPEMDGEETYTALKRLQPNVAVIMTSGYSEQEISSRLSGSGIVGFLPKPYTMRDLEQQLRRVAP